MNHASRLRRFLALAAVPITVVSMFLAVAGAAQATTPLDQPAVPAASQSSDVAYACGQKMTEARFSCFTVRRTNVKESKVLAPAATPAGYGPSDIQSAYDLPGAAGSPTVAIVDAYDDPNAESDLAVYRAQYGLAPCTTANGCFQKVAQDGSTNYPSPPPPGDNWVAEISLDLDAVSAACPSCHILLVEADDDFTATNSLFSAVDTARSMGAKFISMSWGGPEDGADNSHDSQYFDHPGVVYTASTGDDGYSAGVIYPSTSQYVVSVGGTSLARTPTSRGWSESVWDGAGSGCSDDVTKPSFQSDLSACGTRADADISAVADPGTGLAIYNTESDAGWNVYGGTSLSAPLIASMYALAGDPVPGSFPPSYPYDDTNKASDLNDVTLGSNGSCTPNALCQAGTGWDGPSGLGTPNGVNALTTGPHGIIEGQVTDAATHQPISDATVSTQDGRKVSTDANGDYDLSVPVAGYDLTVSKYGYDDKVITGIDVADGATITEDFALTAKPSNTISGTVTDGSGHGWPMRAKITIDGYPDGPIYSDPYTGHYAVSLPDGNSYTLHVASANMPGYTNQNVTVDLAATDVTQDFALKVDATTCTAAGYAYHDTGTKEAFTGWQGNTPQDGWTITDNAGTGQTWRFDNPGGWAPPPGGDADFADIDSDAYGQGGRQDSSLVSPVVDLSGEQHPEIGIDTTYISFPTQTANVDLSLDGGTSWTTVWSPPGFMDHMDIPIPQAAGNPNARVRFHFTASWARRWEIDNVLIGDHACSPVPGGLVAGMVTDANTGEPVVGAKVTSDVNSSESGATISTPDDGGLADGYYWLFSSHTGPTSFTVTDGNYTPTPASVDVAADTVRHADLKIDAGHVIIAEQNVTMSTVLGGTASKTVSFGNDGTAPVHISLTEGDAGFTPMGAAQQSTTGAAPMIVKSATSVAPSGATGTAGPMPRQATPQAPPWTDIADYPTTIMDAAVASHDGKVYVAGGYDGTFKTQAAHVFDPATNSWNPIAALPQRLQASSAAFVGDTLYVVGGWDDFSNPSTHAYAYDPKADSWTRVADVPAGVAAAGTAVVSGRLYVIGGCTAACGNTSDAVYSYDPGNNSWSRQPDYPTQAAFIACGGVTATVVCAGGTGASSSTYAYTPGNRGWIQKADMPDDAWGAATATANGRLEVMGGAIDNGAAVTNQAFAYDPVSDTWSTLPDSNNATYRSGAACGIYQIGGSLGGFNAVPFAESLPGFDQCGGDVAWLSEDTTGFDVAPGQTVSVRVSADSSVLSQPGSYAGQLVMIANTPYPSPAPVGVTMQVNPPMTWGKLTGTVSDTTGAPVGGATVAICTSYNTKTGNCGPTTYTLKTDGRGGYQLWLDQGFSPLQIIAAKDGYTPLMKIAKIHKGQTTTVEFTLSQTSTFGQAQLQAYLHNNLKVVKTG